MTTRFSQDASVQTNPPVCRSTTILPVPWLPPPYPPLTGYFDFQIQTYAGALAHYKTALRLNRHEATNRWIAFESKPGYTLAVEVQPYADVTPVKIYTAITVPAAQFYSQQWWAPDYVPSQAWQSGANLTVSANPNTWCWQSFTTYTA